MSSVAVLLVSSESSADATVAVLVRVPAASGLTVTLIVIWAEPSGAISAKLHVKTPASLVQSSLETKLTSSGSVSVTTTLVAVCGPALVTSMV